MHRYRVAHTTTYRYESTVSSSYGQMVMLPREHPHQRCVSSSVSVEPAPTDIRERVDFFGNRVSYFAIDSGHTVLRISAVSEVEVDAERGVVPADDTTTLAEAVAAVRALDGEDRLMAAHYGIDSPRAEVDRLVTDYAAPIDDPSQPVMTWLEGLVAKIHGDFGFDPKATTVTSTVGDLFETGAGVCQDFAHLAVAVARAQGLPARYVSGYLETIPKPGQPKLVGADVSHAWASVLVPHLGWVDIDPTNNQFVNNRYVTTAWGRDYGDVAPLKGVIYSDGGKTKLDVSVDVARLN